MKIFWISSLLFLLSCHLATGNSIDTITIVAGTSQIKGRIISPEGMSKDAIIVKFQVPYLISGNHVMYEAAVDQSGNFSLSFDVEVDATFVSLYVDVDPSKVFMVEAVNGDVTHIDITLNSDFGIESMELMPANKKMGTSRITEVLLNMLTYWSPPQPLYDKSPGEFLDYTNNVVSERLELFSNNESLLSKEVKDIVATEFRLFLYESYAFDYHNEMMRNYRNVTQDTVGKPDIQPIDRSYFRFLRDFNLNSPHYQLRFAFPIFQKAILQNEILGLPAIEESDIPSWLVRVKATMADLIGSEEGAYYDILAANFYAQQLSEELRPLSEKQKTHIKDYWKDGEIAKILFRKNEQVLELAKDKSPAIINETPSVPDDKVIEAIVSKYKDKVVLIDLWATWCGPCLEAMKKFTVAKGEFRDKDVVFVYITNGSSPQKLWESKIKGIGDEHYYLTDVQWAYMMNYFEFAGIPSYLLYDKEGKLINKFTGFPGNEAVKKMIRDVLNLKK